MADDSDDNQTPSLEQVADATAAQTLGKGISTSENVLADLKKYDEDLRRLGQQSRDRSIKSIQNEIDFVAREWGAIYSAAVKASSAESLSPKEKNNVLKVAIKYKSYWDQQGALNEAIDSWFGTGVKNSLADFQAFLGARTFYFIQEAYQKIFEDVDSPQFWVRVSRIYYNEAASRDILIDRLNEKKLVLELTSAKENFFPSQPNAQQIKDLEAKIGQMHQERQKLLDRMAQRQAFYEKYHDGLLKKAEAAATKEEKELTASEQEEISRQAAVAADRYLQELERQEQEGEETSPTWQRVAVQQTVATRPAPIPVSTPARRAGSAGSGGGWRGFLRNPFGSIQDYLGKFRATAGAAKASLLARLAAGPVGVAITVAQLVFNKDFRNQLKELVTFAGVNLYLWLMGLMTNLVAGGLGIVGGIAGAIIGFKLGAAAGALVGGPIGAFFGGLLGAGIGGIVGWITGYGIGNVISGALGIGGTSSIAPAAVPTTLSAGGVTTTAFGSVTPGGLAGLFGGTSSGVIATFSIGTAMIAIGTATVLTQQNQPTNETEGPEVIFTVQKSADKSSLRNDSNDSITYTVTVINQSDNDIEVSIVDSLPGLVPDPTRACGSVPTQLTKGTSQTICYQPYFVGPEHNNSNLVNVVKVTANIVGDSKKEEQTASTVTKIGDVPDDQPFGFPADGQVVSLDQTRLYAPGAIHKGTVFSAGQFKCPGGADRCWLVGGMDISGSGDTPVYSTVNGTVVYSGFDYGDSNRYTSSTCSLPNNYTLQSPFGYCAVGGVVEIVSGPYTINFLHLNQPGVAVGDQVTRGQAIGTTFAGALPTSTNSHVHYQIFYNSNRFDFGNSKIGNCSEGAILPSLPSSTLPPTFVQASTSQTCD